MKKVFQILLFVMAFQMEVRVRASADTLQQPTGCLKSADSCAIHVLNSPFHLKQEELELHSAEGSTLMRLSQDQWRLVKGVLWVEEAPQVAVETPYATAKAAHGQYWLIDRGDKLVIRNINADLTVVLRDGKKLEVPGGFEFWVSGINSKGKNEYAMIQTVDMKDHLVLWNKLFKGTKEQFKTEVTELRENWKDLAERGGSLYEKIALRQIASIQESQRIEAEKKRQAQAERQKTRELMYKRAFDR
ncbi:hypothetical protein ACLSU7_02795 [Bdellovibrio sp. HCB185ZH]|uniref:hypothetical protein n=1 Tax=Bdellovibrio sp. HCB185ZH TaxID=3394235 RepID=UPI0039A4FE50